MKYNVQISKRQERKNRRAARILRFFGFNVMIHQGNANNPKDEYLIVSAGEIKGDSQPLTPKI